MINLDDCCKDCARRAVGCHNVNTCEAWAEHQARIVERHKKPLSSRAQVDLYNHERRNEYKRSWRGRDEAKNGRR